MKRVKYLFLAAAFLAAGWLLGSLFSGGESGAPRSGEGGADAAASSWTCSMHPQIQQPKPGRCPICAMDLIPVAESGGSGDDGPRVLALTETAKKLAKIKTAPVVRRLVENEIRLVGKVAYDETRTKRMAARFPARIDRLYVDYTGILVRAGDHLARVYSPELLTAQRELLSAIKFGSNVETARDKLRLWDLSEQRIREIEEKNAPSDRMDIDALIGGVVIEKHVSEGDYVETGQALFTISDLDSVWVMLNAYESDLPWIRYGQAVTFEAEAVPGRQFEGIVAFLSPALNPETRTVDVRVNADNSARQLKPEMFVRAQIRSTLAAGGKVAAPELAGKWISPMHPEVILDEPGPCPVCGMDLVKAEDLGYVIPEADGDPSLAIPASAVLRTGKRSIVYVELPDREKPTYEGREIVVGPRAGDFYLVEEGLEEGESVVLEGNFKIDSALQLLAKPSMMNPVESVAGTGTAGSASKTPTYEVSPVFREMLAGVFRAYLAIQEALAADSLEDAKKEGAAVGAAAGRVDLAVAGDEALPAWLNYLATIRGSGVMIAEADDLEDARNAFLPLSRAIIEMAGAFAVEPGPGAVEVFCPMAFENRGAGWMQLGEEIRNPYFGAAMLRCGTIRAMLAEERVRHPADAAFRQGLGALLGGYFRLQTALANDNFDTSKKEAAAMPEILAAIDGDGLEGDARDAWTGLSGSVATALETMRSAGDIGALRIAFEPLSDALREAVKMFQPTGHRQIYELHCPMAFEDRGASWLQDGMEVLNPYFGAEMLSCGSVTRELLDDRAGDPDHAGHEQGN